MAEKEVVILGGRGMLGTDLTRVCMENGYKAHVFDLPKFNISNRDQLSYAIELAPVIINCAAYTNVEKAESEPELTERINGTALTTLGELARAKDKYVIHISTDFVFDGKLDRPYNETDATNPISVYGRSKLCGEQLLAETGCRNAIVRVEWTYGRAGNNFVSKLIELARKGTPLRVIDDQVGSPTATTVLAGALCELMAKEPEGIFHFAAEGYVSRFEMAKFIFDTLKMDVELSSCKTSDYKTAAARPLNSRFDCSKISALLTEPIENWQPMLKRFLENLEI